MKRFTLFGAFLCSFLFLWLFWEESAAKTTRTLMPHEHLSLPRPELEWLQVELPDGTIMFALSKADYGDWNRYRVGLEHEYVRCQKPLS